jgi:hypothetical protein
MKVSHSSSNERVWIFMLFSWMSTGTLKTLHFLSYIRYEHIGFVPCQRFVFAVGGEGLITRRLEDYILW